MNKQLTFNSEKKQSSFRRGSLNAVLSTFRASTSSSGANSPAKASSTQSSGSKKGSSSHHKSSDGGGSSSGGGDGGGYSYESNFKNVNETINNQSTITTTTLTNNDMETFPPPPPPICSSYTHGLSTITERHSSESDNHNHNQSNEADGSRTNSSCSMPDYLCHKLHTVTVNVSNVNQHSAGEEERTTMGVVSVAATTSTTTGQYGKKSSPRTTILNATSLMVDNGNNNNQNSSTNTLAPDTTVAGETIKLSSSTSRLPKESYEPSSVSTTTSESYHLNDLPPLPAKLATLNKPSSQSLIASALRSRKARHSIDVRALPSYLDRKRQSTFGQFLTAFSPTAPEESTSSDDPLFTEPVAPTLSLGERVAWIRSSGPEFGNVKWIGRMPQVTNDWTVGVEFDNAIGTGDGTVEGRRYFVAKENFAKFLPLSDLTKVDNYAGRPRSGTMLSRMSVQLKPGQLISIQRSPTASVPHCYLNAPHHVGHDVHSPNNRHCQCPSCNHPCAHICKTRKPKGKRWTEDMAHMCHFSSKPHAHMCCGGEDLPSAAQPIIEPGVSWKHSEVISSLRTVPTETMNSRRKSVTIHGHDSSAIEYANANNNANTNANSNNNNNNNNTNATSNNVGSSSMNKTKLSSSRHVDGGDVVDDDDVLPSNYLRDNYNSALLERTGSELSISSLPSSSSVAEVYIGRSVLTDESDIDSETERSLESNSKASNKQGLRSLVACFLANSLRLRRSDKDKTNNRDLNGSNKHYHRSGHQNQNRQHHQQQHQQQSNDRHHSHSHSHHYHHGGGGGGGYGSGKRTRKTSRSEKDKFRSKQHRPLGLSSTDGSSYADIPSSVHGAACNTQTLPSLSLDSAAAQSTLINRPAALFSSPRILPPCTLNDDHQQQYQRNIPSLKGSSNHFMMGAGTSSSSGARGSPFRKVEHYHHSIQQQQQQQPHHSHPHHHHHHHQHLIDGHISEEVTNSSHSASSAHKLDSIDRADSSDKTRPSTNASSENASSPRRRRHKGPAPKPPTVCSTQCSSNSPLSTNNASTSCASSLPQSPTNSSVVTSLSTSSKNQVAVTKSPAPLPPHLTRSLSEQKQLNMKNLINALPSFRSEVNLQDASAAADDDDERRENEEHLVLLCDEELSNLTGKSKTRATTTTTTMVYVVGGNGTNDSQDDKGDEIYQTPKSFMCMAPPELPNKTFDPQKMFGCKVDNETRKLERKPMAEIQTSPTIIRSQSMPFSRFTCCSHHWKEYLDALSTRTQVLKCVHPNDQSINDSRCRHKCLMLNNNMEESDGDDDDDDEDTTTTECVKSSDLMNALLSPQHSIRFKKRLSNSSNASHHENENKTDDASLSDRYDLVRAMSDGSLTNASAATVVEFINDDNNSSGNSGAVEINSKLTDTNNTMENVDSLYRTMVGLDQTNGKCLSDVFCQTNFDDIGERQLLPPPRHKNRSCRCRHSSKPKPTSRHCRVRHCIQSHRDCCMGNIGQHGQQQQQQSSMLCFGDETTRNPWLTSSTSDHSLSSLSSSTSTLSEASTMRTSSTMSNDIVNNYKPSTLFRSSVSPFGDTMPTTMLPHFNEVDLILGAANSSAETFAELLSSGRSPISTERLFKSAENSSFQTMVGSGGGGGDGGGGGGDSTNPASAFDPLLCSKSSSTSVESEKKSIDWFNEFGQQMFLNVNPGLPQSKCLMSELQLAIEEGNHQRAATLAKELAIKHANGSMLSGKVNNSAKDKCTRTSPIVAYLYIEDRNTHKGPIPIQVYPTMSVNALKLKIEKEFNIASELQKWVLGRTIATNLNATLSTYGITHSGCPIFLYVLSHIHQCNNTNNGGGGVNKPQQQQQQRMSNENVQSKTNGNLSDDEYEPLRKPSSIINYVPYENRSDRSDVLQCHPMTIKSIGTDCVNQTQLDPLVSFNSIGNSSTITNTTIGNVNVASAASAAAAASAGITRFGSANPAGFIHAESGPQMMMMMSGGTPTVQLVDSVEPKPFTTSTIVPNANNLIKNYYYQEGEIPFASQLIFESLAAANELLPRVEEEDEDDLEEDEDEITAKAANGDTELVANNVPQKSDSTDPVVTSTYQMLVELEDIKCVLNVEPFDCPICFGRFKPGEGVVLRDCLHTFCRECLKGTIEYNEEVQVKCPFRDDLYACDSILQDREVKELASNETYERYLKKSVSVAEKNLDKSFHCKTADCPGKR